MLKNKSWSRRNERSKKLLLWVGIAGISMFFAAFTSAYIVRKAEGNWKEFELPDWFLFSTIVIVCSSISLIIAKRIVKQNKSATSWLFTALLLSFIFALLQVKGFQSLVEKDLHMTGKGSHVSASFLYVITASHLAHLSGGLIALLVTIINSQKGKYNTENYLGIELISIYWHYLAGLWFYLYFFMRYIKYL